VATTRHDSIIPADTARLVTCRCPQQYSGRPRPTAARATNRHPQQTNPVGPSADNGHWARCADRGGSGPGAVCSEPRPDVPTRRETEKHPLSTPNPYSGQGAWPVTRRHGNRKQTDVNPVTGHVAVAQPSWRGEIPRRSARPPALCSYVPPVSSAPSAAHQQLRTTPSACRRGRWRARGLPDYHQLRRCGPQPGAARTGCSSLTRESEQGSAGCYQRPYRKMRRAVAAAGRCAAPDQVGVGAALLRPGQRFALPSGSSTMARRPTPGQARPPQARSLA
jgi:hypothetical protein